MIFGPRDLRSLTSSNSRASAQETPRNGELKVEWANSQQLSPSVFQCFMSNYPLISPTSLRVEYAHSICFNDLAMRYPSFLKTVQIQICRHVLYEVDTIECDISIHILDYADHSHLIILTFSHLSIHSPMQICITH
jgi:hypothetical protein